MPERLARAEVRLVRYAFERSYGYRPTGVWTAPHGVLLAGSPGGFRLAAALPWQVIVAGAARKDGLLQVRSLNRPTEPASGAEVPRWAAPVYAACDALSAAGHDVGGADLVVHADLPAATGLHTPVSIECAGALALAGLHDLMCPHRRLRAALRGRGGPTAEAMRSVCLFARAGHALLLDGAGMPKRLVPLDLAAAGLRLLIVLTGVAAGEPKLEAWDPPRPRAEADRLVRDLVRVLSRGDLPEVGRYLERAWAPAGPPLIRDTVAAAVGAGALGAWPEGGGGHLLLLVPATALRAVRAAIGASFTAHGHPAPRLVSSTAAGAGPPNRTPAEVDTAR